MSYAKDLRAVGQAAEALGIKILDLEIDGKNYVVRGKIGGSQPVDIPLGCSLRDLLGKAWSILGARSRTQPSPSILELRLSQGDIERLDSEGSAKRRNPNGMPNAYSLSQVLRGSGSYVDQQPEARLVGVAVRDGRVTLLYETSQGERRVEQVKVDFLYEHWVTMYLRRANRSPRRKSPEGLPGPC